MIMNHPDPERDCDNCTFPLEGPHIVWNLAHVSLRFHPICAVKTATAIKNNAFKLRRSFEFEATTTPERTLTQ